MIHLKALIKLLSITKNGKIESASRPLTDFGELSDNVIKDYMFVKKLLGRSLFVNQLMILAHVICNQIKEHIDECQAMSEEK